MTKPFMCKCGHVTASKCCRKLTVYRLLSLTSAPLAMVTSLCCGIECKFNAHFVRCEPPTVAGGGQSRDETEPILTMSIYFDIFSLHTAAIASFESDIYTVCFAVWKAGIQLPTAMTMIARNDTNILSMSSFCFGRLLPTTTTYDVRS